MEMRGHKNIACFLLTSYGPICCIVWPINDVIYIQMVLGRRNFVFSCPRLVAEPPALYLSQT